MAAIPQDLVPFPASPDFTRIKALVLDSVSSLHSRRAYDRALSDFLAWYARAKAPGSHLRDFKREVAFSR
jgi:hypothetical protein